MSEAKGEDAVEGRIRALLLQPPQRLALTLRPRLMELLDSVAPLLNFRRQAFFAWLESHSEAPELAMLAVMYVARSLDPVHGDDTLSREMRRLRALCEDCSEQVQHATTVLARLAKAAPQQEAQAAPPRADQAPGFKPSAQYAAELESGPPEATPERRRHALAFMERVRAYAKQHHFELTAFNSEWDSIRGAPRLNVSITLVCDL